ncbi:MAG: tetratricopeptide repeat protein [Gammaproteobacteria bacterium]|nr:tetratricopeptide repeat protein [Gammaproteobacteria bacterium]
MLHTRLFTCFLTVVISVAYAEQTTDSDDSLIQETQSHKVFQGALYKIWVKLRALNPKPQAEQAGRGQMVVTAGIRGAESTESALQPYWKDDRTEDKAFLEQVNSLNAAQAMLDEGKIKEAGEALQNFIKRYPEGELLPNAIFAQGLTQSASGDADNGIKTLKRFIKDYPQHPLKEDAEIVIAEFDK